jgi:peptidoglycan biosynthesis protein MviN/MurJ (putative lipid II flippase)
VISLAYAYLLSEQTDMASANFGWGVMIAVFLLFMVSIPVLVNEIKQGGSLKGKLTWKTVSAGILLGLHLVCGIIFLYSSTISTALVP